MQRVSNTAVASTYGKEELKGPARSMAEWQWLLVILGILYFFYLFDPSIIRTD